MRLEHFCVSLVVGLSDEAVSFLNESISSYTTATGFSLAGLTQILMLQDYMRRIHAREEAIL
jgi:hypothetical protein